MIRVKSNISHAVTCSQPFLRKDSSLTVQNGLRKGKRDREGTMEKKDSVQGRPDPARLELVKNLPKEVLQSLTKEEVKALLSEGEWPESLQEKLKEFVVK